MSCSMCSSVEVVQLFTSGGSPGGVLPASLAAAVSKAPDNTGMYTVVKHFIPPSLATWRDCFKKSLSGGVVTTSSVVECRLLVCWGLVDSRIFSILKLYYVFSTLSSATAPNLVDLGRAVCCLMKRALDIAFLHLLSAWLCVPPVPFPDQAVYCA